VAEYLKVFYHVGFFFCPLVPMSWNGSKMEAGNAAIRRRHQPGRPNAAAPLMGGRSFEGMVEKASSRAILHATAEN
jgi:hypothetical protein